jgi:uncharacterized protein (DUF427 family)
VIPSGENSMSSYHREPRLVIETMSTRALAIWMRALQGPLHEPTAKHLRVEHGGQVVAETDHALLVWEPRRVVPSYAVPAADVRAGLAAAPATVDGPDPDRFPVLHPGIPFAVHTMPGQSLTVSVGTEQRPHAAFRPDDADLADHVILDFRAFDAWYEEAERIFAHPQDPFKRISVRRSTRQVRIEVDGEVLAESSRPRLLFETGLPTRYYLPADDVRTDLLTPTETHTWCGYKGQASYWSAAVGGQTLRDLVWSYPDPLVEATDVQDHLCFLNERVDVFVDGVRAERPATPFG